MNTIAQSNVSGFTAMSSAPATNTSALTAIASIADTLTAPATDVAAGRLVAPVPGPSLSVFMFAGVGADNDTATFRVLVWKSMRMPGSDVIQYTPHVVCDGALVFGTKTGIAGGVIGATYRYADTITLSNDGGMEPTRVRVVGRDGSGDGSGEPNVADNCAQWLVVDTMAGEQVEVQVRCTGTTTAVHVFSAPLSGI